MQKRAVEVTPRLSIKEFRGRLKDTNAKLVLPGRTKPFLIRSHGDYLAIDYRDGKEPQPIWIDYTPVGYGVRPWFCCPSCNRRTESLYFAREIFNCRVCHDLIYMTSKISGNRLSELSLKIRRLQKRLGMNLSAPLDSPDYVGIDDTPTFKPKNMKQATFDRLRLELEIVQLHRLDAWLKVALKGLSA